MKQTPPDIKQIVFANMDLQLYSWTINFRKVTDLRGGDNFNPSSFAVHF